MNFRRGRVVGWRLWMLCSWLLLASCAAPQRVSYPAYFVWIESDQLHSLMHRLAVSVRTIDVAVRRPTPAGAVAIDRELDSMAANARRYSANRVAASGDILASRHAQFNQNFDEFLASLDRLANRFDASTEDYYELGKLTGLCTACHEFR